MPNKLLLCENQLRDNKGLSLLFQKRLQNWNKAAISEHKKWSLIEMFCYLEKQNIMYYRTIGKNNWVPKSQIFISGVNEEPLKRETRAKKKHRKKQQRKENQKWMWKRNEELNILIFIFSIPLDLKLKNQFQSNKIYSTLYHF